MKSKTFISEVSGGGDFDTVPDKARFVITEGDAKEIIRLAGIVKDNEIYKIEKFDYRVAYFNLGGEDFEETEEVAQREVVSTDCACLNVSDDEFWFTAFLKNTDIDIHTELFTIKELAEHFGLAFQYSLAK